MVEVKYSSKFNKFRDKYDRTPLRKIIKKLIIKVITNPLVGKPMTGDRKGFREVRMKPFRLTYHYDIEKDIIKFILIYHKDEQ